MTETLAWDVLARDHMSDVLDKIARVGEVLTKVLERLGDKGTEMGRKLDVAEVEANKLDGQLKDVARDADKAGDQLSQLGDKSVKAGGEMRFLAADIDKTKTKIRDLAQEFDATGNRDIFKELRKHQGDLGILNKIDKELKAAAQEAEQTGQQIGQSISQGVTGELSILGQNPYIAAAIAAGIIVGAPIIGTAVSAAILLGVGGAGLAGGIALAVQDPAVNAAFSALGTSVLDTLRQDATVFVEPLVAAAGILHKSFLTIEPTVKRIFEQMVPIVTRLATGFGGFLEKAMPGIERAVKASVPVFNALAAELPHLGVIVGKFFSSIAKAGPETARALTVIINVVEGALIVVGNLVEGLTVAFDKVFHLVADGVHALNSLPGPVKELLGPLAGGLDEADKVMQNWVHHVDDGATGIGDLQNHSDGLTGSLDGLTDASARATKAFDDLFGKKMSHDEAVLAYNDAVRSLTESIKQNGSSFKDNTVAGDANHRALLGAIQAANSLREANITAGMGVDEANGKYQAQVQSLEAVLRKAGATDTEIWGLIGTLAAVPNKHYTEIGLTNLGAVLSAADTLKIRLDQIPRNIRIGVGIYDLGGASAYSYIGHASGGMAEGPIRVGESGPEEMYVPPGTRIRPNNQLTGATADTADVVDVPLRFRDPSGEVVQEALLRLSRQRGYRTVAQLLPVS